AQYRVRCDGATCQAIHFNFDKLQELTAPGRFDVPLSLSKNEYNGAVSAQAEVRGLHRLDVPERDLCATACDLSCPERLGGGALWDELLDGPAWPGGAGPDDGEPAALAGAHADGRLLDRRGRAAVTALASLAAGGERVLVLVADVARRRPLLSRDVLSPQLERRALYLQSACVGRLGEALAGPDLVMTGYDVVAARPRLAAAFAHVVLLDPPCTRRLLATVVAAAPEAWVHALWGPDEAGSTAQVAAAGLDLDAAMRRAWRALSAASGRFDKALAQELLGGDPFLRSAGAAAAALRALRDAGLLHIDGSGGYHLERPRSKVDVTQTDTCKAWHNLFQTSDFLRTCLTAGI
ncbi:MAG: hypothetical protein WCP98_19070, partial [Actinomycetes bacterium]